MTSTTMKHTTRSRRRTMATTVAVATVVLLTACGGGGKTSASSAGVTASPAGDSQASSTSQPAPGSGSGIPSRKPCDLLTKKIAEDALGVAVGDAKDIPGQGNETCAYSGTDKSLRATVLLTTYSTTGSEAELDQAATQFKNAYAVNGLADAARVSIEDHAIGVLKGDFVFAMSLTPPSAGTEIPPVTEAELVNLANAVLAGS